MCTEQPSTVGEALAAVQSGLAFLNQVAVGDLPGVVQAGCLRELARAESAYTAAHARMLGAFSASQVHHLRPKAKGGKTTLTNLVLLCAFHHLIAVHQWGWTLTLNADGTTTATSP
ncbi:MAG TPA: HNH endonuclease, partial [Streptosporangiaceae bacterium]